MCRSSSENNVGRPNTAPGPTHRFYFHLLFLFTSVINISLVHFKMIIKNYHCLKTQKYLKVSKSSQLQGGDVQAESRCSQICRQPWPHVGLVMMMMMMMVMLISLPAQKWKLSDQSLNSRSRERNAAISKGRGGRVVPMPAHLDEVFKNIQWWLQYKIHKMEIFNSKVVV